MSSHLLEWVLNSIWIKRGAGDCSNDKRLWLVYLILASPKQRVRASSRINRLSLQLSKYCHSAALRHWLTTKIKRLFTQITYIEEICGGILLITHYNACHWSTSCGSLCWPLEESWHIRMIERSTMFQWWRLIYRRSTVYSLKLNDKNVVIFPLAFYCTCLFVSQASCVWAIKAAGHWAGNGESAILEFDLDTWWKLLVWY